MIDAVEASVPMNCKSLVFALDSDTVAAHGSDTAIGLVPDLPFGSPRGPENYMAWNTAHIQAQVRLVCRSLEPERSAAAKMDTHTL